MINKENREPLIEKSNNVSEQPVLAGYHFEEVIGMGTYGYVYRVYDVNGDVFAAKEIEYEDTEPFTPDYVMNEWKMLCELAEYRIMPTPYNWFSVRLKKKRVIRSYIIMEYIDGEMLHKATLTTEEKYEVIRRTLYALMVFETHHWGHYDIKPQNIMISRQNEELIVHVIDGSLCEKMLPERYHSHYDLITLWFRPPEIYMIKCGGKVKMSPKHDMWSFGCVIIGIVFGDYLFKHGSWQKHFEQTVTLLGHCDQSPFGISRNIPENLNLPALSFDKFLTALRFHFRSEILPEYENALKLAHKCLTVNISDRISATEAFMPFTKETSSTK